MIRAGFFVYGVKKAFRCSHTRVENRQRGLRKDESMMIAITIETETIGDSTPVFRLIVNGTVVATGLTTVEAQLVVCKSLERIALPRALVGLILPARDTTGQSLHASGSAPVPSMAGAA
jgi:hypothetical protein